jgi:hypothetical protein
VSWRKGGQSLNQPSFFRGMWASALTFLPVPSVCTHQFLVSFDLPLCTFRFGRVEEQCFTFAFSVARNFTTVMMQGKMDASFLTSI